ncbi:MAG: GNAT family N-acetyltransferase [Oscillospiraceae bacterium]|nr:GNAT family N-acetyltransferase [Oscillospiraceae bacterium]
MDITIRRMRPEDAEAVTDILMGCWKTAYRGIVSDEHLDNMDRAQLAERRRQQYRDYIVAVSDGEIVGYCWYVSDDSYTNDMPGIDSEIVALYVKPELKRRGIGKKLFLYAVDDLRKQDRKKMVIWCLKDNLSAARFYEDMGGTAAGEHRINIGGREYDEVGFLYSL